MPTAPALPPYNIAPATPDDMPFIRDAVARLRLDGERLEAQQFIVLRREGRDGIIGFGRVKPYRHTHELGCVAVVGLPGGGGWGGEIAGHLGRHFPPDAVYIKTDLP